MERGFAVIGLGYAGLPVALALAKKFEPVIGFDISRQRIAALQDARDVTGEVSPAALRETRLRLTADPEALSETSFFVITVPTPIDAERRPDLAARENACTLIGPRLKPGAVVVFESTVYPRLTREFCGPLLVKASGLRQGIDFKLGYSPERINPGDKEHRLETIVKVVAGEDETTLERIAAVYARIVEAGIYRAFSLEVAEAAKVIENTQRDLNIALMNELAIIFDRLGIPTKEVLEAAGTKWNFLRFTPGLVGGHCIGVDPYYLTARAESAGYYPQVILSGRRINDGMGGFIAQRLVKLLIAAGRFVRGAKVGIVGITFKENVSDLRNSRVPDIVGELREFGISALVADPVADPTEARREYGIELGPARNFRGARWADLGRAASRARKCRVGKALPRADPGRGLHRCQIGRRPRSGARRTPLLEPLAPTLAVVGRRSAICVPFRPDRGDKVTTPSQIGHLSAEHEVHVLGLGDGRRDLEHVLGLLHYAKSANCGCGRFVRDKAAGTARFASEKAALDDGARQGEAASRDPIIATVSRQINSRLDQLAAGSLPPMVTCYSACCGGSGSLPPLSLDPAWGGITAVNRSP